VFERAPASLHIIIDAINSDRIRTSPRLHCSSPSTFAATTTDRPGSEKREADHG